MLATTSGHDHEAGRRGTTLEEDYLLHLNGTLPRQFLHGSNHGKADASNGSAQEMVQCFSGTGDW
eukprot:12184165-Prorocentrum_lima.AAC.1